MISLCPPLQGLGHEKGHVKDTNALQRNEEAFSSLTQEKGKASSYLTNVDTS